MPTLAEWRTTRRTTITLPSGLTVQLQRVSVVDVAAQGAIPTPLYNQVSAMLNQRTPVAPTLDLATFPDYAALVNVVAAAALVEPAVAEVADATHITLDELPFEDRLFIFNWAQGGAAALATFPGNPGPSPRLAPDSDHLRTPAKRAAPADVA